MGSVTVHGILLELEKSGYLKIETNVENNLAKPYSFGSLVWFAFPNVKFLYFQYIFTALYFGYSNGIAPIISFKYGAGGGDCDLLFDS